MTDKDARNTLSPGRWLIAVAAAVVAAAVSYLLIGLGFLGSTLIGIIVLLVVAFFLGLLGGLAPSSQAGLVAPRPPASVGTPAAVPVASAAPEPATAPQAETAPPAEPAPTAAAAPAISAEAVGAAPVVAPIAVEATATPTAAVRPTGLASARDSGPDDLKRIKGIGPKLEQLCHRLGYFHFDQIAAWTAPEVAWVDDNLEGFKGRVTRDDWVSQAKILATGGETEFSSRQG